MDRVVKLHRKLRWRHPTQRKSLLEPRTCVWRKKVHRLPFAKAALQQIFVSWFVEIELLFLAMHPCFVVNGGWTTWSIWGMCSEPCGKGIQIRNRYCSNPRPQYGGKECNGSKLDDQICNDQPCPGKKGTASRLLSFPV